MTQAFTDPMSGREEIIDGTLTARSGPLGKSDRLWDYLDGNGVAWRIEGQPGETQPGDLRRGLIWKAFVTAKDNKYGITELSRAKIAADDLLGAIEAIDGAAYQFKVKQANASGGMWWLILLGLYALSKKGGR